MFSDPQKNIEQMSVRPGMHVADLGAGSGFYSLAVAKVVGADGRVYAVDAQQEMLQKLKTEAQRARLVNIEVLWGDIEKLGGTKLRDVSVEVVLVCNVLFQIEHKDVLVTEVRRILKPNGKILVVDWKESFGNMGPHADHVFRARDARLLFENAGFAFEREISAGAHHYGFIFRK